MNVPESWLRAYCNPSLSSDELCHALTMAGLEVDEVKAVAPPFTKIVVAEVKTVDKHPNADKLNVCSVDAGTGELLQIVCGAPNVAVGIKVPCALVGAELPPGKDGKPFVIGKGKLRGVESFGMLCSARELGISEDHGGLLHLSPSATVGQDIRAALNLDERVMTLKLTPNKADCLSIYGVAREVQAITGAPLLAAPRAKVSSTIPDRLNVKIEAPDLCGRFSGRVVKGVNAKAPTPDWMRERLERAGQRSISALVDISNYVMLELGRPSHIFDRDKVEGTLHVRWGKPGETVKLLNGNTVSVDATVGVIADDVRVEALAGIMGGDATAVSDDTTNIFIEAAFWWPQAIQGRARRYNFSTDAGHRFERGVDYATTVDHIEVITKLVLDLCGGQAGPVDDQIVNLPTRKPVSMRIARAKKIIGVEIPASEMAGIFTRLGLSFTQSVDTFTVTPPSHRFDIEIEEDLIEEVARIYGFERIPANPPKASAAMRSPRELTRSLHALRSTLAACDYHEVVNYSFVEAELDRQVSGAGDPIKLLNPIASNLSVMRRSLITSLLGNLRFNLNHQAERVRVFEVGRVFSRDAGVVEGELSVGGVSQPMHIAGLAFGDAQPPQWGVRSQLVDFFDVRSDVEALIGPQLSAALEFQSDAAHPALHPGRTASIWIYGKRIGVVGELHPRLQSALEFPSAPIVFELQAAALQALPFPVAEPAPKFPMVARDLALVVDQSVPSEAIRRSLASAGGHQVTEIRLFDQFRGGNLQAHQKSLAYRVLMRETERTMTDAEADKVIESLIGAASKNHGANLR